MPALMQILIVYTTVLIDIMGLSLVLPILPFYAALFDASAAQVGLLFSVYAGAQLLSTVVMSRASDRVGRRPMILASLAGSAFGLLAQGLASSIVVLIVCRGATGLLGGSFPLAQAYVADITTREERPKYLGFLGATAATAFIIGPAIGAGKKKNFNII